MLWHLKKKMHSLKWIDIVQNISSMTGTCISSTTKTVETGSTASRYTIYTSGVYGPSSITFTNIWFCTTTVIASSKIEFDWRSVVVNSIVRNTSYKSVHIRRKFFDNPPGMNTVQVLHILHYRIHPHKSEYICPVSIHIQCYKCIRQVQYNFLGNGWSCSN